MNGYVNTNTLLLCKFPSSKAGLSTIGYTLLNADGTVHTSRSTSVVNRGNGSFSAIINLSVAWIGSVLWDTGETTLLYAEEDISISDIFHIPDYVGPVVVIPAPPTANLQRLTVNIKQLGLVWALGDEVHLVPSKGQIVNGSFLKTTPVIALTDSYGNVNDPTDDLPGVLLDKTAIITIEIKRSGGLGTYYSNTITISSDDTKDLSSY
jgi:hypothetical protein